MTFQEKLIEYGQLVKRGEHTLATIKGGELNRYVQAMKPQSTVEVLLLVAILVFFVALGFAVYLETTKTYDVSTYRFDRWPITSPCDTHPENCKAGGGPTYYKP